MFIVSFTVLCFLVPVPFFCFVLFVLIHLFLSAYYNHNTQSTNLCTVYKNMTLLYVFFYVFPIQTPIESVWFRFVCLFESCFVLYFVCVWFVHQNSTIFVFLSGYGGCYCLPRWWWSKNINLLHGVLCFCLFCFTQKSAPHLLHSHSCVTICFAKV